MPDNKNTIETKKLTFTKALPWILIISGVVGLICSFVLTHDEMQIAKNANYIPNCNLNPVIACGSVMKSSQAHLFALPNPWIGLATFSVMVTVGAALLASAKFKKWFWLGLQTGVTLGTIFAYWLLWESVYRIHALCPYCLTVDVFVTITFWYTTLYNLQAGHLGKSAKASKLSRFIVRHHLDIIILWFLIAIALILKHFWYYYGHYF